MDGELFILEEEDIRAEPDIESPLSEKQDISTQHLDEPVELDEPTQPTFELATDSDSSLEEEGSLIDEEAPLLEEEIVTIEPDSPPDFTQSDIESLPSEEYDPSDINAAETKELEEQQYEEDLKIIIESDEPVPATDVQDEDVVKFEDHDADQEDSDPLQDLIDQPEISESIEPEEVIEFEEIEFLEEIEPLESSPPEEEEILEETDQLDLESDDEELFKELLLDEEGDEVDPSLTTDEDESEDVDASATPSVEQEAQETAVETPPEEPEFLEDFEIYEEEEPQKLAPAQTTAQEKPQDPRSTSFFKRLAERLSRTRDSFINQMDQLFLGKKQIDSDLLDDLEELLITSDLGVATTSDIIEHARRQTKRNELSDPQALKALFKEKIRSYIMESTAPAELVMPDEGPFVIMVIGVNGVGKTTTIGKITHKFIRSEQSVLLVAADTFRAAAVSQLTIWGDRNNVKVVSGKEGVDPSSVAYDAMDIAREKDYDVVIVDTAGRLHTQSNLMEELKKIKRVMGKRLEGAPHEILLVLDATTGQNGVSQAKLFNEAVGVTGLAVTKLDGTAKGGIVANVCRDLKIPIRFIGIGEQIDDLRDFDPDEFIEALFHERDPS
ncbi:MAG: signal recognition particle-docking protein FtsY [Desulfobulbaceae bacterium]|nr:signal recognition particle-docking protein FtsY [Desulfobulbaceae bacterium]